MAAGAVITISAIYSVVNRLSQVVPHALALAISSKRNDIHQIQLVEP